MYVAAVRNQSCSISSRGRLAEDRNSSTKNSGKKPWTASAEPNRRPMKAPRDAVASAISAASANSTTTPPTPASTVTPAISPTTR